MNLNKNDLPASELEVSIVKDILRDRERLLMQLFFDDALSEQDLEKNIRILTDHYDIDSSNMNYSLMLAVLGFRIGWMYFPSDVIPRLKGIHRYCQAKNVMGMPWLLEKLKTLRKHGIPVMLIKGLAMRYFYAPNIPRIMNDYDIAVPRNRFREAMLLLHEGNVRNKGSASWSDTIIGKCSGNDIELDVHQWIFKEQGDKNHAIWDRSIPINLQDVDVLVPSPEDMLVHLLDTKARDLFYLELPENRMKWLFDCRMIFTGAEKPDLQKVQSYASELHCEYSSRLMLILYAHCFHDNEAFALAEKIQPDTTQYRHWLRAELDLREEFVRWNAKGFLPYGPLNFNRAYHVLCMDYKEYRVYRCWPRGKGRFNTFIGFMLWKRDIAGLKEIPKRYIPRLSLDGVHMLSGRSERGS